MMFQIDYIEDVPVIRLQTNIGTFETQYLRKVLDNMAKARYYKVIIDFDNVSYITVIAIAVLLAHRNSLMNYDGNIILLNINNDIKHILDTLKVIDFNIFNNEVKAIKFFET